MFYIHGQNCSSEKGRLKVITSCKGKVGLVRMRREKKENIWPSSIAVRPFKWDSCVATPRIFFCLIYICNNWCKKIFIAKTGTEDSLLSKDYSNQWTVSLCSFPFFHTINPVFLSVVQRFNGNRRGQPYSAEFIALHLLLKQRTVIKEFAVQRTKGYHPGYQKSWVYVSPDTEETWQCCFHYCIKGQQTPPISCECNPTQGGHSLRMVTKASPSCEMEKETFSVQDWWLAPAGTSHCQGLRNFLWSSEPEL